MKTLHTNAEVRETLDPRRATSRIGLVPTMGAFHDGHVALFRVARRMADVVVVSSFVNPAQFGDPADLLAYPRDEVRDARMAENEGVDVLFAPAVDEIYPPGFATWIDVEGAARGLEGDFRPGHFRGVATVCAKLFAIVQPHVACFGQKDAQQVAVVTQVVRDLNLNLAIEVVPTVRDTDGLALSSRNVRLSPEERKRALAIPRALAAAQAAYRSGADPLPAARAALAGIETEYVEVADLGGRQTLAIAVRVGRTRLIDNVVLGDPTNIVVAEGVSEHEQAAGANRR
jgi:pantoate--beta-alanine ligase